MKGRVLGEKVDWPLNVGYFLFYDVAETYHSVYLRCFVNVFLLIVDEFTLLSHTFGSVPSTFMEHQTSRRTLKTAILLRFNYEK